MEEGTKTFLAILAFIFLVLALNPSLITTTSGSIAWGENFSDIWSGFGLFGQSAILIVIVISLIAVLIGSGNKWLKIVQETSWKGRETRRLRQKGLRGGYTRYANRRNRTGLQVVKNRKYYNDIFSVDGKLISREIHYQNVATNDRVAKRIYEQSIKNNIPVKLRKQALRW